MSTVNLNTADQLSVTDLIHIAREVSLLKLFAARRCRSVTVDYVPARPAIILPRESDDYVGLQACPPAIIPITYTLEDCMFGGNTYAVIVCGHRTVVSPFIWTTYEELGTYALNLPADA